MPVQNASGTTLQLRLAKLVSSIRFRTPPQLATVAWLVRHCRYTLVRPVDEISPVREETCLKMLLNQAIMRNMSLTQLHAAGIIGLFSLQAVHRPIARRTHCRKHNSLTAQLAPSAHTPTLTWGNNVVADGSHGLQESRRLLGWQRAIQNEAPPDGVHSI